MTYKEYTEKILQEIGLNAVAIDYNPTHVEATEIIHKIEVNVKLYKYGNSDGINAEITLILPPEGVSANAFAQYCAKKENIEKTNGAYYGIDKNTYMISPWDNNFLCLESKRYTTENIEKAVDNLILLAKKVIPHLAEYSSLRRYNPKDKDVIEKAKEIIANADLIETDVDREFRSHYIKDRNSFFKGWFYPFNDNGKGTFDTLWPASVDFAAKVMGIRGSFEYAVASILLEDKEFKAKALKACRIREETIKRIY